jgi:hypothetical protein
MMAVLGGDKYGELLLQKFANGSKNKKELLFNISFFLYLLFFLGFFIILMLYMAEITCTTFYNVSPIITLIIIALWIILCLYAFFHLIRVKYNLYVIDIYPYGPDIYEKGILFDYEFNKYQFLTKREFLPFSKVEKVVINPPVEFIKERAEYWLKCDLEDFKEELEKGEFKKDEMYKANCEDIKESIFIIVKDAEMIQYYRDDIVDIKKFEETLKSRGVQVIT